jgi:hypothetical protein
VVNDLTFFHAVRKLPSRYLRPGINVSRFGEGHQGRIIATHAASRDALPTLVYRDGRWVKDNPSSPVRRR